MGTFGAEIGPGAGSKEASITPNLLRFQWVSSIRPMGILGQDRQNMPLQGPNLLPNRRRGNVFDPSDGDRDRFCSLEPLQGTFLAHFGRLQLSFLAY